MRVLLSLAVVSILASVPLDSHAQWKWRDAEGRVTISDRPPPQDVPLKDILSRPPGAERKERAAANAATQRASERPTEVGDANSPAAARNTPTAQAKATPGVDPELDARKKKLEQEQLAKQNEAEEKQAATMRDNCLRARSHMASLDSGVRLSKSNEKGEREILDDAQRAAEVERTREAITANCK